MQFYSPKHNAYRYPTRIYDILGINISTRYDTAIEVLDGSSAMALRLGKYIVESPTIVEDTKALIAGLDEHSCTQVLSFINRLRIAYLSPNHIFTNLSPQEIAVIQSLKGKFYAQIVELTPQVFCYKGYFLPLEHFEVSVFYYKHNMEMFSPATLARIRDNDIIDVGGFVGDSAIIFEREFTTKKVHSFEATKNNFDDMLKTLELNNSKRIIPINKGLGEREERLEIVINGSGSAINACGDTKGAKIEQAHIITLDSYVRENNIKVGFIKVDIEGFEQPFLRGALETIKSQKPAMLVSIITMAMISSVSSHF